MLIAQLATSGGVRAPLAHIANQVFVQLSSELENQGLSRKVTADMFGMSLRTYRRKTQRLKESLTDRGRSLWEAILDFLEEQSVATRGQILDRFHRDEENVVRGILRDMVESQLVFCSGTEMSAVYRIATTDELKKMREQQGECGLDEMVWAIIYREGPIQHNRLLEKSALSPEVMQEVVQRLHSSKRIQSETQKEGLFYRSRQLIVGLDSPSGWEASVYDHFHALVRTVCSRLNKESYPKRIQERIGGSTYTIDVAPGHPMEQEVLNTLQQLRAKCTALRERVSAYNKKHGLKETDEGVVIYFGQSVILHDGSNGVLSESSKASESQGSELSDE